MSNRTHEAAAPPEEAAAARQNFVCPPHKDACACYDCMQWVWSVLLGSDLSNRTHEASAPEEAADAQQKKMSRFLTITERGQIRLTDYGRLILRLNSEPQSPPSKVGFHMLELYAIKDVKSDSFDRPIAVPALGVLIRELTTHVNNPQSQYGMYSRDFQLYRVGSFDQREGIIAPHGHGYPEFICGLETLKQASEASQ